MEEEKAGVIYILTNPSFKEYVKFGYASNLEERLNTLNRSECIPFAFRVYATYDVMTPLQDKDLHNLIDNLNKDLRAIETFNGKLRKREFFAMSPETAYSILENIAKISKTEHRLHKYPPNENELKDEVLASEVQAEVNERKNPLSFFKCGLKPGTQLTFREDQNITATVINDRKIEYQGKEYSLSGLAQNLLNKTALQGSLYWMHNGKTLQEIRAEREANGLYEDESRN